MNECIARIREIYGVEALTDSIVSYFPHFRPKRQIELKLLYDSAYVALGGKRIKGKWHGVARKDGKPVQFLPFRLGLQLMRDGLALMMENYWLTGLTDASYEKFLSFHLDFEAMTHSLCHRCAMRPSLYYGDDVEPISTFREHYRFMIENRVFDNTFMSCDPEPYPISPVSLDRLVSRYTHFFPVYDSYLQISKGEPVRFLELIAKANQWQRRQDELQDSPEQPDKARPEASVLRAREAAEQRVKVMPAIRWQVFQRDGWKCVACGRASEHDVILHIDHIIPRSRGGTDTLDNYQTLCSLCNLGKSNRNDTDLRSGALLSENDAVK
jgi:hypothetical protein